MISRLLRLSWVPLTPGGVVVPHADEHDAVNG